MQKKSTTKPFSKRKKEEFKPLIDMVSSVKDKYSKAYRGPSIGDTVAYRADPYTYLDLERALNECLTLTEASLCEVKKLNFIDKKVSASSNEEAEIIVTGLYKMLTGVIQAIDTISPDLDLILFVSICKDAGLIEEIR